MPSFTFPSQPTQGELKLDEGPLMELQRLAATVCGPDGSTLAVQERIGSGRLGSVFLGRLGGVEVAVKEMLYKGGGGTEAVSLADRQAQLGVICSTSLVHPNVVGVNALITVMIISRGGGGKTPQILPNKCKLGIFPPL